MSERIVHVDAFTDRPFSGNPAAVCLLERPRDAEWMQSVAREMNLSETAFLERRGDDFDLRWFTPTVEVDLCGHATLASVHVLWEDGVVPRSQEIRFHTRSGVLGARADDPWIELDFPARPAKVAEAPAALIDAAGAKPVVSACGEVGGGSSGYLLELESEEAVRSLRPDFHKLAAIPDGYLVVTALASTDGYDFVSRFFASQAGIDEDPVTGSAHCTLGPWWGERLGKDELFGYQASARGGTVRVRPRDDRVLLGGRAVTVLRGELVG
jgi:PhzF family phenazine biosynthesis protein